MFIGQQEKIEFQRRGRPQGSKDRQPRQRRIGQVAAGLGAVAGVAAAARNPGAVKAGLRKAGQAAEGARLGAVSAGHRGASKVRSGVKSARQKVGTGLENRGSAMQRRAGYDRKHAITSGTDPLKSIAGVERSARKKRAGQAVKGIGTRIRGN